ncbi:hypothetical protein [Streptomyces sp. NPDC002537]
MHLLPHICAFTAPARRHLHSVAPDRPRTRPRHSAHDCPRVYLALHGGTEREYLLDDPLSCPRPDARLTAYDERVHLAYILARQGHDAQWLARFADLPLPAAHRITEAAALSGT